MFRLNKNNLLHDEAHITFKSVEGDIDSKIPYDIGKHYFNTKINIQMAETSSIPHDVLKPILEEAHFYEIKDLNLMHLCSEEFIVNFVRSGQFLGHSCSTRLDEVNSAAFVPTGELCLSLDNFTYHKLGISGALSSQILRNPKFKYVVRIDTKEFNFAPKKKLHERTLRSLKDFPLIFNFSITWLPKDENICPSSIAKYFHDLGYHVEERTPNFYTDIKKDIKIPSFQDFEDEETLLMTLEWIGIQSLPTSFGEEELVQHLGPLTNQTWLNVTTINGYYLPEQIHHLILRLKKLLSEDEYLPWIGLTVFGPPDCCVSWATKENSFRVSGDNFCSLLIKRDKLSLFTVKEATKPMRFYAKSSNKD